MSGRLDIVDFQYTPVDEGAETGEKANGMACCVQTRDHYEQTYNRIILVIMKHFLSRILVYPRPK